MNCAIIVAAGSGTRFGGSRPKQFVEILGKPLLFHTIEKFERCADVDEIILVLPAAHTPLFLRLSSKSSFRKISKIVAGGATRADSVRKGLGVVRKATARVVVVHDGARPLVGTGEISRTIAEAHKTGAACLAVAVTDTIKELTTGGLILRTLDRTRLRRAVTPQAFSYEILTKAFEQSGFSSNATDECALVERLGRPIAIVEGDSRNIKVTTPDDIIFVEGILSRDGNER
jgi:2-C-methyl-D-erythritol 4-phosphate cytidylyltransferase